MSGGRERSMDAKSDAGRAQAGKDARGGGGFGGRSIYGGGGGGFGGTTNEMAKRVAPRMDVPVTRTVDTAPRGLPNRTNEPGERVASYPWGLEYGIKGVLGTLPPGPTSIVSGILSGLMIDKYNEMGMGPGPQVGTSPTQTRSNLGGGSGVGGSVNSGGALGYQLAPGYMQQPLPQQATQFPPTQVPPVQTPLAQGFQPGKFLNVAPGYGAGVPGYSFFK